MVAKQLASQTVPTTGGNVVVTSQVGAASGVASLNSSGKVPVAQIANATTLTDGATINLDASLGNLFRVTLGGNRTLAAPTNATDGQRIILEVIQDGTGGRTLTLTTGSSGAFAYGTDITTLTLTGTASKRDLVGFIYSGSASRWLVTSVIKGF